FAVRGPRGYAAERRVDAGAVSGELARRAAVGGHQPDLAPVQIEQRTAVWRPSREDFARITGCQLHRWTPPCALTPPTRALDAGFPIGARQHVGHKVSVWRKLWVLNPGNLGEADEGQWPRALGGRPRTERQRREGQRANHRADAADLHVRFRITL